MFGSVAKYLQDGNIRNLPHFPLFLVHAEADNLRASLCYYEIGL